MKTLKIYFTSDIHGAVYPTDYTDNVLKPIGLLNLISAFKKDDNTLIIDGGDTIQGTPFATYLKGEEASFKVHPIAEAMNAAGYDYVALGNHDFNYGYNYLKCYLNSLDATCLCANIEDEKGELNSVPSTIKVMGNGIRVGLIGITTDFITRWEKEENLLGVQVKDTYEAVEKEYKKLKGTVDVLIGIYHGGFEYDLEKGERLSATKENIAYKICKDLAFDVLLTGHQHMPLGGQKVFNTYCVQTPPNGSHFIELEMQLEESNKDKEVGAQKLEIKGITSRLRKPDIAPDREMKERLQPIEDKVQEWLDKPVGFLDTELQPTTHLDMALKGSYLANFINQVQREVTDADIACTSFANSIKGFNQEVTVRDIVSTYVYPNTLVVLEVTGKVLKAALERSASYFEVVDGEVVISDLFLRPKVEHYNYDYFSNINYTFDISLPIGKRVTEMMFKGEAIQEEDKFTLVMNNYRASGSGGYECYIGCKVVKEVLIEMPEIIIEYFKRHEKVVVDKKHYLQIKGDLVH